MTAVEESYAEAARASDRLLAGRRRDGAAVAVAAAFVAVLLANLSYPAPRGPADNGDFARVFRAFSTGPVGFRGVPVPSDPSYGVRFFHHFHRHWQLAPRGKRVAPTTSLLVYAPGRALATATRAVTFDLTLNAAAVALLLGLAVFAALRRTTTAVGFGSLAAIALLASDGQVAMYLASFYQEAGAYAFTLLLVCSMFVLWHRPSVPSVAAFTASAVLLAGTKFPFAPSAVLVGVAVLAAWIATSAADSRREKVAAIAGIVVLIGAGAAFFDSVRDRWGKDVSYNFVFAGALPELPPEDRGRFLASIEIAPRHAGLAGKCFYDSDSRGKDPPLHAVLGNDLHLRAILRLAADHPGALLRLLRTSFARSGVYDIVAGSQLGTHSPGTEPSRPPLEPWSRLRGRWLSGGVAYGVGLVLLLCLGVHVIRARALDDRFLYGTAAAAFWAASVGQVAIAILGNGPMDLNKHLWFANLLLDVSLVLAVSGLVAARHRPAHSA